MAITALTSTTTTAALVKTGNGEYTAASVSADQAAATALGLVKEKDGNYGTNNPNAVSITGSAAAQSSPNVLAALASLTLGG